MAKIKYFVNMVFRTIDKRLPFRLVIKSLHISSTLMCPSSVSWLIIFHMKTNLYKYLHLKSLSTIIKTYTVMLSPSCQLLSTLFCSHLLHQSKFAPPAHFQTSGSISTLSSIQNKKTSRIFSPHPLHPLRQY